MLLLFFILWIILNGRVTLELVLLGIPIAAAVFLFARAAFGYSVRTEGYVLKYLPLTVLYLINLMVEIIRASLNVIAIIINPSRKPDPVLIEFDSGLPTEFQNVVLANSITLTPGTITIDITEDGIFSVHALTKDVRDGVLDGSMQAKVAWLYGETVDFAPVDASEVRSEGGNMRPVPVRMKYSNRRKSL